VTTFTGSSATLRPAGVLRYFTALFLLVWLAGWAAGEAFALGFLALLVRSVIGSAIGRAWPIPGGDWIVGGAAGFMLLFLLVWLTLWTVGGVAALRELLRSIAGEDRISIESLNLELQHRAGPFRRTRLFERSRIRRARLRRHDKAVVLDTISGTEDITAYGSDDQRRALVDWLRSRLLLPDLPPRLDPSVPPPGWRMAVEGGSARLTQEDPRARIIGASLLWTIAALLAVTTIGAGGAGGRVMAVVLTLATATLATWVSFARRAWLVRHGELTAHTRFLTWERAREFKSARLEVALSTDSDNDEHYALNVIGADSERKITSTVGDETDVIELGKWLSARTGFPLKLPRKLQ
jgi:hypothetical protein